MGNDVTRFEHLHPINPFPTGRHTTHVGSTPGLRASLLESFEHNFFVYIHFVKRTGKAHSLPHLKWNPSSSLFVFIFSQV